MNDEILEITGQKTHPIAKALDFWIGSSERFKTFVYQFKDKISKKCSTAKTYEDLEDVRFELEIPYLLLLDDRFLVEYEKFGTCKQRSPDFTATFDNSVEFNIEVKRIREHIFGQRYAKWLQNIVEEIRKIPSSLGFSLDMVEANGTAELIDTLEREQAEIIHFIKKTIIAEEPNIQRGFPVDYEVPNLKRRLVLILSKPPLKANFNKTSYYGGIEPIFYTQKEHFKISDSIFEKLGQIIPGMVNVIICTSNSSTHEREDLHDAIGSINTLISKNDEGFFIQKGFEGIQDFLSYTKNLSGIMFRSTWSEQARALNSLWCNKQAENQIPEPIREYLSKMTAVYP